MSYNITTTSGATLATIADGTVNATTTSLTLIGKNYAGYGIFLNENYIKLLENFSSASAPSAPLTGQLWYDSSNNLIKVYNSNQAAWKVLSSSFSQATQPLSSLSVTGDLWWNTATLQLSVFSGSSWVIIGPSYTSSSGTSGAVVETILDTSSVPHVVVKFYISNVVIAILSGTASTFSPQTAISGFATVKPGLNLISSSTLIGAQFTGDVSNSLTLQGIAASQFLRADVASSNGGQLLTVGKLQAGGDLLLDPNNGSGDVAIYSNNSTAPKDISLYYYSGGQTRALNINKSNGAVTIDKNLIVSGTLTAQTTLSVTGATTLSGATQINNTLGITGATSLATGGGTTSVGGTLAVTGVTTVSANITPNATGTVYLGSSSNRFANVYATYLVGTAIQAQYADLAERFEADAVYTPGTVVELGGVKEITAVVQDLSEAVFGIISTAAGFLMNGLAGENATHPPIAMSGRVPVRVVGRVKKGDRLVSAGNGMARSAQRSELTAFNVIGRALENKDTDGEGMITAAVKVNS